MRRDKEFTEMFSEYDSDIHKSVHFLKLDRSDALHFKPLMIQYLNFQFNWQHTVFTPLSHYRKTICQHLTPHTDTIPPAISVPNDSILMRKHQHLNA